MDKIEEILKDKEKEFENIKAPEDMEEKLREALDKPQKKRSKVWKGIAVAAGLIAAIGLGSLSFIDFGGDSAKIDYRNVKGGGSNSVVYSDLGEKKGSADYVYKKSSSENELVASSSSAANRTIKKTFIEEANPTTMDVTFGEDVTSDGSTEEKQTVSKNANSNKKIIKNANAAIKTKKAEDAFNKIAGWVIANGGYEFSRNINSNGTDKQVNAEFRINPDKLAGMLDYLNSVGKVTDSQVASSDITDQYQDTASRLKALKKGRDQMMKVMDKAKTVEDILSVQNELNNINADIESLQGQINSWDKQVAESSVSITIFEEKNPLISDKKVDWKFNSPSEVLESMKNGFVNTVNNLFNVLIWILVFLSSSIPFVIIGAILVFVLWRFIKKRRGRI
ncbi:MAG TPA: DUF4349 domain-containing protein [Clostridia bacterium]|nr:DUF4349 domain-containing protein [Clostridia bacterium]